MTGEQHPELRVAVVGGGPAGLMAAEVLATAGVAVTVFERMPTVGRKLLLAGRGGLNITHTEPLDTFLDRYGNARPFVEPAIAAFGPHELRAWCAGLGQAPFVGTSGRVFPEGFRATPLLRAWLRRLTGLGVEFRTRYTWRGFDDPEVSSFDAVVLALGGASWPRTGSDGAWVEPFEAAGVDVVALRPANCGFVVAWTETFSRRFAGTPLKNIVLSFAGESTRGEAMVTSSGIEGGAVYALSRQLRTAIETHGTVTLFVDLHPDLTVSVLADRLRSRRAHESSSNLLRRAAGLAPVAISLLREATANALPTSADELAALTKRVPITLRGAAPIDRAISTAGGIALHELDASGMLIRRPGTFVAGEMLDWEAPTGGYLLQATFSTAVMAAHGVIAWLAPR